MSRYVVADFESTMSGMIFSMSFMPVEIVVKKQWVSHGRNKTPEFWKNRQVTRGEMQTIFVQESLEQAPENKIGRTIIHAKSARVLPFRQALEQFIACVHEKGDGNWLAHSMDNELELVWKSDIIFGTRLFPKFLKAFPDVSVLKGWAEMAKICTQHLLTTRCPNFFRDYTAWMTMNGWVSTRFSSRLEDFVRFVKNDRDYRQKHLSTQDTLDLMEVLLWADPPLDGKSYMISTPVRDWMSADIQT